MRVGFVSISDARDIRLHSGTSKFIIEGLEREGVTVMPLFPLDRSFRYLFSFNKLLAECAGRHFIVDRHPIALNSYAAQIERKLANNRVDLLFSNSSVPLTRVHSRVPKLFWTDAVWQDMRGYYAGQFSNPTRGTNRNAMRQEIDALRNVDAAVYTSAWAARTAGELSSPSKISVIPRGANIPVTHDLASVERWARERSLSRCVLLFVGMDWARKGGPIAVQTAAALNTMGVPTDLVVIGCKPAIAPSPFIKVVGYVDKNTNEGYETLSYYLKRAAFLILPTSAEAGGIVFCEASAFGVPSLTYDTGGTGEYVRAGVNGFTYPAGAKAEIFAHAVKEIREDPDRYVSLSLATFREYKSRLNWNSSIRKLLTVMDCAAAGSVIRTQTKHQAN